MRQIILLTALACGAALFINLAVDTFRKAEQAAMQYRDPDGFYTITGCGGKGNTVTVNGVTRDMINPNCGEKR